MANEGKVPQTNRRSIEGSFMTTPAPIESMADAGAEPAAPHATPMPSEAKIGAAPGQPGRLTGWTLYVAAGTAVLLGSTVLVAALQFPFLAVPLGAAAAIAGAAALAATLLDRRRNQEPLHRAGLMATVLDGTDAAHLIATPGGAVVFANAATARLLDGRPVANLVEVERALAGDERSLNRFQRLRRSVESGSPFAVELRRATPDDGSVWWHVSARPLPGLPDHIHWRIEDITTRQEREAILREEQVKLVDFMDHAPVGFYSVDQDGKFVFANATLADWLGVEARDLVRGARLHDFLVSPPADAPPYALTAGRSELPQVEIVMRGPDGRRFEAAIAQTVVHGEDGQSIWTRSVVRDLTPERLMREALRASEVRFQRFFQNAPIGIALLDQEARLTEWNGAFEELIGADVAAPAGKPIAELLDGGGRTDIAARLGEVLEGGEPRATFDVGVTGSRERAVTVYVRRLEGGPDEAARLILQFIDQTDQKNLEMQFAQSHKMQAIGQLAGGVAHDFNNLLTAMIGFCDLLLLRHKPGDASFGDIMQIKQNANRAANLVRQLLAFSRQQTLQPRVLNITDVLAELSNLLRRLIGENIELKMHHGRELGLVKVDQGQLEQVIINLTVNARDAMSGDGQVTIKTRNHTTTRTMRRGTDEMPRGDYVCVEVTDTGTGIAREHLDRIFEPFFSTKEVGSGTGLGLSMVYGIVRQTGGFIFVDSKSGKGTTFTIYLPRHVADEAGEPAVADGADAATRDLTGAGCILLVEDEDPVRLFSARALRNKGYEVLEAKSGEDALVVLEDEADRVDLLITDVVMPQMDGPTLITNVRKTQPDMKVICISGYTEDRFRQRIHGGEEIHFLPKPFSLKQLASKVKDVIHSG